MKHISAAMTFVFVMLAPPAHAYIGPGLGVAVVWTLFGPLAALVSAVLMIGYFPARYYYKKWKKAKAEKDKNLRGPEE